MNKTRKLDSDSLLKFDNFNYDPLSIEVWGDNYKAPGETTREEVWTRMATSCSEVEKIEIRNKIAYDFLSLLYNDKFIPGGRILANLGVNSRKGTTLYNCFVHNPADIDLKKCDSIEGIYSMLMAQAKTLKSEGGYGINASWIRPAGSYIRGIGSRTPGVLKFMELWDKSSEIITQGSVKILGPQRPNEKNKIRKGAQMLVLDIWHPDIEEFIIAKQTPNRLTKFNVSVGITEGFMEAVVNDKVWDLKFPDTEHQDYDEKWFGNIDDWEQQNLPVIRHKQIKARILWDLIMRSTFERNEPGVLFLDVANKLNPVFWFDKIRTTNPCGEVPMSTGVCNLGSLNLPMFVTQDKQLKFDFEQFATAVKTAIRFLDNINDISDTPLPEYKQSVREKRRIGLGVMGLGSLHMMLGIKYGSSESLELSEKIFKIKCENELLASAELGKEKGSFLKFDREQYFQSYWWKNLKIDENIKKQIEAIGEMRNSHQSMNAPTGNTGIYARNVSGGIEPVFSTKYVRWSIVPEKRRFELIEAGFKFPDITAGQWHETEHVKFSMRGDEEILSGTFNGREYEIDKNRGLVVASLVEDYGYKFAKDLYSQKEFDKLLSEGKFATANELTVSEHLSVLSKIAGYVNMSISKTINIPNHYSYEDFKTIYLEAWKANIKGVTTYREGTMTAVLETEKHSSEITARPLNNPKENHAPKRPSVLPCDIYHVQVKGEKWNFFVGLHEGKPYEIFAGRAKHIHLPKNRKEGIIKKNGSYNLYTGEGENELKVEDLATVFENPTESAFTRTVSLALRHGIPIQFLVEQIEKGADKENDMFTLAKGLMRVLKRYIQDGIKPTVKKCPECKSAELAYQEGCLHCKTCGFSKCS